MKLRPVAKLRKAAVSLPVRGAWIEIVATVDEDNRRAGRSPCGERGLKSFILFNISSATMSLPVRGAWIEMFTRIM